MVAEVVIVPPFVKVVAVPLKVNVFVPIANVPPNVVVKVPLTVIAPSAVYMPEELLNVKFV